MRERKAAEEDGG